MVLFADLRPVGIVKLSHRVVAHRALIGELRPAELLPHLICAKVKVHHIRFAARIIAGIKDHTKSRALQHRHIKFHVESIIKGFLPDGEHVAADADALVSAGDQGPIPAARNLPAGEIGLKGVFHSVQVDCFGNLPALCGRGHREIALRRSHQGDGIIILGENLHQALLVLDLPVNSLGRGIGHHPGINGHLFPDQNVLSLFGAQNNLGRLALSSRLFPPDAGKGINGDIAGGIAAYGIGLHTDSRGVGEHKNRTVKLAAVGNDFHGALVHKDLQIHGTVLILPQIVAEASAKAGYPASIQGQGAALGIIPDHHFLIRALEYLKADLGNALLRLQVCQKLKLVAPQPLEGIRAAVLNDYPILVKKGLLP